MSSSDGVFKVWATAAIGVAAAYGKRECEMENKLYKKVKGRIVKETLAEVFEKYELIPKADVLQTEFMSHTDYGHRKRMLIRIDEEEKP